MNPSRNSLCRLLALSSLTAVASWSSAQQAIDGLADYQYNAPIVCQNVATNFGDNLSELDVAYSYISGGTLYITLAGNLENNSNKLNIFIDSKTGGQNQLRGDNWKDTVNNSWYLTRLGNSGGTNGLKFEAGFTSDYFIGVNRSGGQLYLDYSATPDTANNIGFYLGQSDLSFGFLTGGTSLNIKANYDGSNTAGTNSGTSVGYAKGGTVSTGLELAIPLAAIGNPTGTVRICAFVANSDNSFLSNQFLPGVGYGPGPVDNYGEPRVPIDLGGGGSNVGTQYFVAPWAGNGNVAVLRIAGTAATGAAVSVLEYNPATATNTATVTLPSGSSGLVLSGNATTEGQMQLSADGRNLVMTGYAAATGATMPGTTGVFGMVNYAQTATLSTQFANANTLRGATLFTNDQGWLATNARIPFVPVAPGTVTLTQLTTTNARTVVVFNNQLYAASSTAVLNVGTGLPSASTATGNQVTGLTELHDFCFGDAVTLYTTMGSASAGVLKHTYSGGAWSAGTNITGNIGGTRSITVTKDASGKNVLYVITLAGQLKRVTDNNDGTSTVLTIATVTSGQVWRGVEMSPFASNTAPVAGDQSVSTDEDTAKSITLSATDAEGNSLTYSYGQPTHGTVTGTAPNVTYTPDTNYNGPDAFTFTANDGALTSNTGTINITVDPVDDIPVAVNDSDSVDEDSSVVTNVVANDTGLGDGGITVISTGSATNGVATVFSATSVTFTPNTDFNGVATYEYTIQDSDGDTSTATVTVTVNPVDDLPVAVNDTETTDEDTAVTTNVLANDTNLGDGGITVTAAGSATNGTVSIQAPDSVIFTPTANYYGIGTYEYTITDADGDTSTATVTVTINPTNDLPTADDGSASGDEDTNISGNATGSDPDGDALTYSKVSDPANGSVVMNNDGSFTYTPNANFNGSDSFTFKVNDGTVDSNVATISITVNPTNDAPTADDGSASGDEDTNITGMATGSDPDSDALTFSKVSDPANGSVVMGVDGSFTYTPNANFNGSDSFTFKVNDGTVDSNVATISITVNAVNDAPTADDGSASGDEDTNISGNATGSDPDGDALTYSKVSDPANGSVVMNNDGSFTYTPNANFNGSDSFTFKVNDGQVDSNIATISITVNPTNDAPTADDGSASGDEDTNISGNATGSDPDGDALTYSKVSDPANGSVVMNNDGSFTYTPNANFNGSDSFTFKVNDGQVDSNIATISITVNAVNDAPTADDGSASGDEDTNISGNATGSDPDGDALTYSKVSDPANGSVVMNNDGSFTYTPNANFNGSDSFTFKVNDGQVDSNIATISLTVNPVDDQSTAQDDTYSTAEDTQLLEAAPGVLGNDTYNDVPGLVAELVSTTTHGVLILNADGSFDYTPNLNYNGLDSFTYKAFDGASYSNTATVTITVTPVLDVVVEQFASPAPNFYGAPSYFGWESNSMNALENGLSSVGDRNTDPTAYIQLGPVAPWYEAVVSGFTSWLGVANPMVPFNTELGNRLHFGVRILGNGTRIKLANLYNDMNSNDFDNVFDNDGDFVGYPYQPWRKGIDYGPDRVKGTLDDIVYNNGESESLEVDEIVYVGVGNAFDATFEPGFTDQDRLDSVRCYVGDNEPYIVSNTYVMRDDSLTPLASSTVTVTLDDGNTAPVANSDTVQVAEDTPTAITLTGTDAENDPLTFNVLTQPVHGTLSGTAPNLTYTPDANYSGPDSFTFNVSDGVCDSNTATISINVNTGNDIPVANNGVASGDEDTAISGNATGSDGDGDALTFIKTSDPNNGSVVMNNDGSFTYTPNANFNGTDSFMFKVNDGTVDSNVATISITVNAVNDAPTADDGSASGDEDTNISGNATGSDPDGDALTYSKVSDPANGSVVMNNDGSFTYTPNANFNGSDSFTFKVNDGTVDSNVATISITVNAVNDAPTADDGSASGDEDTNISGNATGSDPDGDALTYSKVSDPANGSVVMNNDGSFTYTPNANFNGSDSFTFKVNDGQVDSNIATISITVNAVNDAPTADDGSASGDEDTNISGNATGSDPDGDALTYSKVSDPTNGSVVMNNDGSFTYTPNANFNGSDSFTFKVNDGTVDSNVATISITVNAVNDAPVLTVPGGQMIAQCVDLAIMGVSVSDVDVEAGQVEADLQVANGTLTLTTLGGLTFSTGDGTGDGHMVFTGTLADVNAALATLHYMSNSGFSGTDTLTATVSDLGNTGSGGPKTDTETINIEVTPVGASTVHPAGYTVIEGYELTGGLSSLLTSDDDTLALLNDENTLGVTVEFFATAPCMNPSELTFAMEVSVGRFGLSQEFLLYNYSTNQWDAFAQGSAPTVDTVASLTLNGSAGNYVNQTTGEVKARMHWQPINDEDPAQDGWPHYIDEAKWIVTP